VLQFKLKESRESGKYRLSISTMTRKKRKRIMRMRHGHPIPGLMWMLGSELRLKGIKTKKGQKCSHLENKGLILEEMDRIIKGIIR
jgi:hypothetical protein